MGGIDGRTRVVELQMGEQGISINPARIELDRLVGVPDPLVRPACGP